MTIHASALGPMTLSEAHEFVRNMRDAANDAAAIRRSSQPVTPAQGGEGLARSAAWPSLRLHAGVRRAEVEERADVDRHRADGNVEAGLVALPIVEPHIHRAADRGCGH